MTKAAFDEAATDYDSVFTHSCVGKAQRGQVWKYVDRYVTNHAETVLEINCGTGHDANAWSQRGKSIIATDISQAMLEQARLNYPFLQFAQLDATQIHSFDRPFDTLFSNFGGLNCLSPSQLQLFFDKLAGKMIPGQHVILVIMGKKCMWERFYFTVKGQRSKAKRRNTEKALMVDVEGEQVATWYYSPKEIRAMAEDSFQEIACHPIGLFVPPSYLAPAFERRKGLFSLVKGLDSVFTHSGLSNQSDHFIIILKRI